MTWLIFILLFSDMLASLLKYETPKKTRSYSNDYITLEKNTKVIKLQDIQGSLKDFDVRARVSQRIHDIPRVIEYCNSPRNPVMGQEGNQAYLSRFMRKPVFGVSRLYNLRIWLEALIFRIRK